jgi:hypothetical protein
MSEANTSAAENRISKQGSIVVAHHESAQCYFRPETEELVFIADSHTDEFEHHWRDMMISMDEFHQANANYSRVLESYAQAAIADALAAAETRVVDEAEIELEKKRDAIKKKLGDLSQKGLGYDKVVELIPIAGQRTTNQRGGKRNPYVYVKKGYFSNTREGKKLHSVSLKSSDKKGAGESIYSRNKNGKLLIDTGKLTQQLKKLEWPKIKIELQDVLNWAGSDVDLKELSEDYVLFDWAESWNNSLHGEKEDVIPNVDISGSAQFMRFVSNVGASAEFDVDKGQASIKGEYKRTLTLASGVANLTFYAPDRTGWALTLKVGDMGTIDMGMLRLCLDVQADGFIGGSLQLEGQLQVITKGDQQMVAGQPGGRLPRFRERKAKGREFYQTMAAEDEGLQLSGEFFRGGRAEFAMKGSLQWLKPSPPPTDPMEPLPKLLSSAGKFTDFCTIGSSIAGLVGVGVGGKLHCTFINGKFCFHVAASLCWGVGAKGGFIAEVGAKDIVEFGAWLVYQLYSLDYSFFDVVEEKTFLAYSQYCVMQMASAGENIYRVYDGVVTTPDLVADEFKRFLTAVVDESKKGMEASKARNRLARNIIEFQRDLLLHTPEAKGILLYLLTRHGKSDHLDLENRTLLGDIYPDRKEAIICVLRSIQTVAEWNKVMCRITTNGLSLAGESSATEVVKEQVQHLVRFLQEGHNRDEDLHRTYKRLKKIIAWGHALDMNDTAYYQLNSLPNSHFPQRCQFGPCEAESNKFV